MKVKATSDKLSKASSSDNKKYSTSDAIKTKSNDKRFSRINFFGKQGRDLPVALAKDELIDSVIKHQTTVIVGETGSGKSTQLPKFLAEVFTSDEFRAKMSKIDSKKVGFDKPTPSRQKYLSFLQNQGQAAEKSVMGNNCIVCTQPRRVAAVTVARRVAEELGVEIGQEVGYSIRFEDKTTKSGPKKTRIKFCTDGVLLRECLQNKTLDGYSVVILDEAHERSLQTDILMGIIRDLQVRAMYGSARVGQNVHTNFIRVGKYVT